MPYHIPFLTSDGKTFVTSDNRQYKVIGDIFDNVDSFPITFYQSFSDPNTVTKNLDNDTSVTMNGTLRSGTSLVNPTILVQSGTTFMWNYAYIPAFNRYYFITDVQAVSFTMYEISMRCDVLMTYREGILAQTTRVLRSQNKHNWDYTDTLIPTKGKTNISIISATLDYGTWKPLKDYPLGTNDGDGFIQLRVASALLNGAYVPLGYTYWTLDTGGISQLIGIINSLGGIFGAGSWNIKDIILDAKYLPCGWIGRNSSRVAKVQTLGYKGWAGLKENVEDAWKTGARYYYGKEWAGVRLTARWRISQTSYLNGKNYKNRPPYKDMAIVFNPFGNIKIDAEKYGQLETIYLTLIADPVSGNAELYISDTYGNEPNNKKELIASANIAVPLNIQGLQPNLADLASSLTNVITSIGNPSSGLSSAVGLGKTVSHSATASNVATTGSGTALMDSQPYLTISTVDQADPNLSTQGWFFNGDIKLSECHGFCKVDVGVHLDSQGFGFATEPEIREIETLLTSGVVLP